MVEVFHSEFVQVPDFKDVDIRKLESFSADKKVSYEIIDSIYDPKQKAGIPKLHVGEAAMRRDGGAPKTDGEGDISVEVTIHQSSQRELEVERQ